MTDNTTDDTEQPSRDELESRVEQLEQTVQQMLPSRRDALKLGGTALAAGGLGSALTGSASAGSASVGTVGTSSDPVDIEAEDITLQSSGSLDASGSDINNVGSLDTEDVLLGSKLGTTAKEATIADDSTATFTRSYGTIWTVMTQDEAREAYGIFIATSTSLSTAASESVNTSVSNQGGSALSGSTGPDNSVNFARNGDDHIIENRSGDQLDFTVRFTETTLG